MIASAYTLRNALPSEFEEIGKILISVYSQLEGFPKENEQPNYYKMLANIGDFTLQPQTELLVAADEHNTILGAVVYFNDMKNYGSGGIATQEQNSAGFRLLGVAPTARGKGIGKLLTQECIQKAAANKRAQLIIHSTLAMKTAWEMYEKLGFKRSEDLDFMQGELAVFGFRLPLNS
ncbi:hypothetical protein CFS9_01950 [Flavobacterium sp. CFS9]|uniref:N-acetyltransferase domain-containing protein n=1 Tax=Flavobacterium sp. CFS9 TaxID=3143118 RepID=A0AAT9GWG0_9FLAO